MDTTLATFCIYVLVIFHTSVICWKIYINKKLIKLHANIYQSDYYASTRNCSKSSFTTDSSH